MTTKYVNALIVAPAIFLITAITLATTTTTINFESVFAQSPSLQDPNERSASPYAPGQVSKVPGGATEYAPGQVGDPNQYAPGQIGDPNAVAPGKLSKIPGGATEYAPGQVGDPNEYSPGQIRGFDPQPEPPG